MLDDENITKFKQAEKALANLFSFIIIKEMQQNYGNMWMNMRFMKDPPWEFRDCLLNLRHYWKTVYKNSLQKQTLKIIEDLILLLKEDHCMYSLFIIM